VRHPAPVRLPAVRVLAVRVLAVLFALTWLILPGFGLIDLSVTWDPDWPVVLEASWGVFMTVLVGGSFLAVAVAPHRTAPAQAILLVSLATWMVAVLAGLEWPLLLFVGVLLVEAALVAALLPGRERLELAPSPSVPLLVVAALGVVPGVLHAERMFASNRREAGVIIGDVTMGVDHYAVQGALALALPALALLAAVWPRGRRFLGVAVGVCAGYVGLVSFAFPGSWAGVPELRSALCIGWGIAVAVLSLIPLQPSQLRGEVVEAQRAL
jgi:hypothetical protein